MKAAFVAFSFACLVASSTVSANEVQDLRYVEKVRVDDYQIAVELEPKWDWQISYQQGRKVFVYATPEKYYPQGNVEVRHFSDTMMPTESVEFQAFCIGIIEGMARGYGVKNLDNIKPVKRGYLYGFEVDIAGEVDGNPVEARIFAARTPKGTLMTASAQTGPGKMSAFDGALSRSWRNIVFLEKDVR
jgi:hypothetical protein